MQGVLCEIVVRWRGETLRMRTRRKILKKTE